MVFGGLFLGLFFGSLIRFSFVTHPVVCCLLLVCGSASICMYTYLLVGFRWYILMVCLVYVGGVYVLFVYVVRHLGCDEKRMGVLSPEFVNTSEGVLLPTRLPSLGNPAGTIACE